MVDFLLEGMTMVRISNVIPLANHHLEVQLDNGNSVILNFESRLQTIRFGMLAEDDFFNKASTNGLCVTWDDKLEVSVSEVFQLAQK